MRRVGLCLASGVAALVSAVSPVVDADVTHIVQRGHTIEAIAHRYRVTTKSILDANHLTDAKHLKPGQSLTIPGVDPPGKRKHEKDRDKDRDKKDGDTHRGGTRSTTAEVERPAEPRGRNESDSIHAVRLGEDFHIRLKDGRGHVPPSALKAFERMMRQGNASHPIDPRLVALVGIVSNHFGGKTIEVVSGYRAYTPTQYSPHSNHNHGKALDFRIRGITDESLRDFCRTLRNAGCGYYPNSSFVHLDVRETKAFWVDWSRPGEPPRYDKAGVAADEGTSDVPDEKSPPQPEGSAETPGAMQTATPPNDR